MDSPEGENLTEASLLLFLFVPFALLTRRWTRLVALLLAGNLALIYALWFYFTQQNLRFLEAGAPVLAGLSAIGLGAVLPNRHAFGLRHVVIVLLLIEPSRWFNYITAERSLGSALGVVSTEEYFKTRAPDLSRSLYQPMMAVNDPKLLPRNAKVLLLGEAQTFYCRRPCAASTVFDTNALEEIVRAARTPEDIRAGLQKQSITQLYVNTAELRRLQTTYRYVYEGQERLGMLDGFNWELFGRFAREYLRPVWTYPAQAPDRVILLGALAGIPEAGRIRRPNAEFHRDLRAALKIRFTIRNLHPPPAGKLRSPQSPITPPCPPARTL